MSAIVSGRRGFSTPEMMVALVIATILFGGMTGAVVSLQQSHRYQRDAVRDEEALRAAERVITTALRTAGADPRRAGLAVIDPDPLGHGVYDNLRVVADFNPVDGDGADLLEDVLIHVANDTLFVRWQAGGAPMPAAYPVRALRLRYFDRNQTALTTAADVQASAVRVEFTLAAPADPATGIAREAKSWVFLRNRGRN